VSGEARRFGAFSVGAKIIHYTIKDADSTHFFAEVTRAELNEVSLTEHPHLDCARVITRRQPAAMGEVYALLAQRVDRLSQVVALMRSMQMEARP
jgi:hypothetical protein